MKSYLSLIGISARVHKQKNRMMLFCIIISVFLVTTIFSLADMVIRTETGRLTERHGNWHLQLKGISGKEAAQISKRSDVSAAGWSEVFNFDALESYYVEGRKAVLYGVEETYFTQIANGLSEGTFPKSDEEVMLSTNAKNVLGIQIGDSVNLQTPSYHASYVVSGFGEEDKEYYQGQTFLIAVSMTQDAFQKILEGNGIQDRSPTYYVQFQDAAKAGKAKKEIQNQFGMTEKNITENFALMGLSGTSDRQAMKSIYSIAAVLFVLVLLAGVLMISGSMNSNVTQRIPFFGMMRCIGASRRQVMHFVRLEALNWCKKAVPIGVILGTFVSWCVGAILRFGIGGEFAQMPLFMVSTVGVISGICVGIVTVLLAAQSPAKRAAKAAPVSAVAGVKECQYQVRCAATIPFLRIETSLGIQHAISTKKNWFLMTGSFALSIILFLCFSVGMDFARALLPSLREWQPDCTIIGYENALSLDKALVDKICKVPGVENVYGNSYMSDIKAITSLATVDHINLLSYNEYMLNCSSDQVVQGDLSKVYGDSRGVLTIYNKNNPLKVGDKLQIADQELEIACAVSDGLFASDLIVICSEETFARLMGEQNYGMINIQLEENATDETLHQVSKFAKQDQIFKDERESNRQSNSTYWATRIMGYGFLIIIGMITVFYMMNSISMSVSAQMKKYGVMRAVGMEGRQLTGMIAAEAFTYSVSGFILGCVIGLPISRFLYIRLITRYFGTVWTLPFGVLGIIFLFVFASAFLSIYAPIKRIQNSPITEILI